MIVVCFMAQFPSGLTWLICSIAVSSRNNAPPEHCAMDTTAALGSGRIWPVGCRKWQTFHRHHGTAASECDAAGGRYGNLEDQSLRIHCWAGSPSWKWPSLLEVPWFTGVPSYNDQLLWQSGVELSCSAERFVPDVLSALWHESQQ